MALAGAPGAENPSAAFLAGQQHGAALAVQHHMSSRTPAVQPKPPAKPAAPTKPKPGGTAGDALLAQAQALAKAQTAANVNAILGQQRVYTAQGLQQATDIHNAAQAAAQLLQSWNFPGATSTSYTDAANALGALAKGFTGQTQTDATNAADQVAANIANLGSPTSSLKTSTGQTLDPSATANVLYGLGGFIPGNLLETAGQAAAARERTLPLNLLAAAQDKAAGAVQAANDKAATLTPQILDAQGKLPALTSSLYGDLLKGQAQVAAQRAKAEAASNPNASLSRALGYLVDSSGNPVLRGGKLAVLPGFTVNGSGQVVKVQKSSGSSGGAAGSKHPVSAALSGQTGYWTDSYGNIIFGADGKPIPWKKPVKAPAKPTVAQSARWNGSLQKGYQSMPAGTTYAQFLAEAVAQNVPLGAAIAFANTHWPITQRATAEEIAQIAGATPQDVTASGAIALARDYRQMTQSGAPQAYAISRLGEYGWNNQAQAAALDALWTRESNWNPNAVNPSSGAAGIPQALGHGHVYNLGDFKAQIDWGLNYIAGRYGSPVAAWLHEQRFGWY